VPTSLLLSISPLVVSAGVLVGLLAVTWRHRADATAPWLAVVCRSTGRAPLRRPR
jgi:hypothetical protein